MKVYEKIYNYYVKQMNEGALSKGDRMPSLRETEQLLSVSRTSVETAYLQLSADGYIYSVEKVGYFVTGLSATMKNRAKEKEIENIKKDISKIRYDLATIGEDKQASCLPLWTRYMKSALRQEERLLSYSDNQGEEDLRVEIAKYVRKKRNIICSADDIVIGAGFQSLLTILIALNPTDKTISFPTKEFSDGAKTFEMAGYQVNYRDKNSALIYVTPSYMTKWGEVMTMKRRRELIDHAFDNDHLIIEDDYQNEFVFSSTPTPSLYAMTGGERVAFLGSFSSVLLPSVRISYIILPKDTKEHYQELKKYFNQTTSKAEQIALAQFLRDGHLNRHIKKIRKLQEEKRELALSELSKHFSSEQLLFGASGMEIGLKLSGQDLATKLLKKGINVNTISSTENDETLLLSFSRIPMEDIPEAVKTLYF